MISCNLADDDADEIQDVPKHLLWLISIFGSIHVQTVCDLKVIKQRV